MTDRARRRSAALVAAVLLGTAVAAAPGPDPAGRDERTTVGAAPPAAREITLRPGFVLREAGPVPLDGEPPHPGEVVGLILAWPDGEREALELVAPEVDTGGAVPLKLVPQDPRVDGDDVIEVLLLGLGEIEVPPILLRAPDGTTFTTGPVTLEVASVLAEDDTEPAPARGQAGVGLNAWGIVLWAGIGLALVAGAVTLYRRRRRSEAAPAPARAEPEVPPEVWAHTALDELLDSNLLAAGRMKEFHVRLAEIAKEYLSRRFRVHLLERTTDECPEVLGRAGVDPEVCRETGEWLAQIDLVKFAGERPPSRQVVESVQALRNMVGRTTPKPSTPEIAAAADSAEPAAGTGG